MQRPEQLVILYIEDRFQYAQLVQARLQQHGYRVDLTSDGERALAMLEERAYDLVLLNPNLPMPREESLLQTLAARIQGAPDAPSLLLVEENHDIHSAALALALGAGSYLFQGDLDGHAQLLPVVIERTLQQRQEQLEKERALEQLRQDNRNLTLLTKAAQLLTSTLDMQRVIAQLVQTITDVVVTEGSSVWLWDRENTGHLTCASMFLDGKDITSDKLRLPPGRGLVGWVAEHGQAVNVVDAGADPRFASAIDSQMGYETRSILAVPLITHNQVIGVLEFVNKLGGDFNERDVELAETLAAYAANSIENARLMESVRQHRDALEMQNESLDAFAHSVAHDLKNPLTLIVGFADMLRDSLDTIPKETMFESLNTIVEYGIKMSNIVDALLLLASVGGGNEVETEPVDMAYITREVIRRMEHTFKEYQAELALPSFWPVAMGYGPWLEEVWYNYLSNAVKYGGRPPMLQLGCDVCADGVLRFWVKDNGPGIMLDSSQGLFVPQPRDRRDRTVNGHGLGLSIVHRIIDRLGGEVGVESQPGQGSTFYFTLPAASAEASTAQSRNTRPAAAPSASQASYPASRAE